MKTEFHLRIISVIIAFSLLFLGLHNQQPILAEIIKTLMSLLIIIYFITIWMHTKKVLHFASSMLLPIWLLVLSNSGPITDFLFLEGKEKNLQHIAQFIISDSQYKKLTTYSLSDFKDSSQISQVAINYNLNSSLLSTFRKSKKLSSPFLIRLLKQNHLTAFQLCHDSILFHINNHRQIRYYFEDSHFIYPKDKKIKPQWYSVPAF